MNRSVKASHPWEIRPPSPRGDADENQLFSAVGRALTEWEQVENACAQLFAVLVSANQRRTYFAPAIRGYGCIIGAKSRSAMLREAAKAYFAKRKSKAAKFESDLRKLLNAYDEFANRRNEIAHGSVQRVFVTQRTTKRGTRQAAIGLYLMPSFYNPRKFKDERFTYQYTSSDLIHYRQEFTKLLLRIGGLQERMRGSQSAKP